MYKFSLNILVYIVLVLVQCTRGISVKEFSSNIILFQIRLSQRMDKRLLVVLIPVLAAASWALYNIGRAALQQLRSMS